MTKRLPLLITLCWASFTSTQLFGQVASKAHKDSLIAIVDRYLALNLKVFQKNSTRSDIDEVFDLFTEDFAYFHPRYGGEYSRERLYNGYIRNQRNGAYDGSVSDIEVINRIVGLNALVLEKRFLKTTENGTEAGELEMTLFEFRKGKISRIFEYW